MSDASVDHAAARTRLSLVQWAVVLGWPVVVALAILHQVRAEIAGAYANHTPVVVLNRHALAMREGGEGTADEKIGKGLARAAALAKKLADEGYIVLDRTIVLEAPASAVVGPP